MSARSEESIDLDLHLSDTDEKASASNGSVKTEEEEEKGDSLLKEIDEVINAKSPKASSKLKQEDDAAKEKSNGVGEETKKTEENGVAEACKAEKADKIPNGTDAIPQSESTDNKDEANAESNNEGEGLLSIIMEKTNAEDEKDLEKQIREDEQERESEEKSPSPVMETEAEAETSEDGNIQETSMDFSELQITNVESNSEVNGIETEVSEDKKSDDDEKKSDNNDSATTNGMDVDATTVAKTAVDCDDNKENVSENVDRKEDGDDVSLLHKILVNTEVPAVKGGKRTSAEAIEGTKVKKLKLECDNDIKAEPSLSRFAKFMLDKKLKGMTREDLEIFCLQKVTECVAQRGEIADLSFKLKAHEQVLEQLRVESKSVTKASSDLTTIHKKVAQDLDKLKANKDFKLIIPKITRSVGLQAFVRDNPQKKSIPIKPPEVPSKIQLIPPSVAKNIRTSVPNNSTLPKQSVIPQAKKSLGSIVTTTATRTPPPIKPKPPATPTTIIQPVNSPRNTDAIVPKINGNNAVTITTTPAPNSGIIDLTDEDEKTPQPAVKVNLYNSPKNIVVIPQSAVLKLGSPNVIVSAAKSPRMPGSVLRPVAQPVKAYIPATALRGIKSRHPAALPPPPPSKEVIPVPNDLQIPPKPILVLNKTGCGTGIVLSWRMPDTVVPYAQVASYQLYAYQETKSAPKTESWGKIGDVAALELPMAVTLTQFAVGNRYFFAVRPIDVYKRYGQFSDYKTILL